MVKEVSNGGIASCLAMTKLIKKRKMKKILIALFAVTLTAASSIAQTLTFDMKSSYGLSKDTVTNTGTNSVKMALNKTYSYVAIQPTFTKLSGTITFNSAPILQGSIDGTNWVTVNAADTLHMVNQTTNTTVWKLSASEMNNYYYYRVYYAGAGTMSGTLKAKYICRLKEE